VVQIHKTDVQNQEFPKESFATTFFSPCECRSKRPGDPLSHRATAFLSCVALKTLSWSPWFGCLIYQHAVSCSSVRNRWEHDFLGSMVKHAQLNLAEKHAATGTPLCKQRRIALNNAMFFLSVKLRTEGDLGLFVTLRRVSCFCQCLVSNFTSTWIVGMAGQDMLNKPTT